MRDAAAAGKEKYMMLCVGIEVHPLAGGYLAAIVPKLFGTILVRNDEKDLRKTLGKHISGKSHQRSTDTGYRKPPA